ncbi:hypothetical protein IBX73_01555 [candidate division WOR-3 bacterium]|nr:hypothetical protein [candidate division WOR-3 bacterium]
MRKPIIFLFLACIFLCCTESGTGPGLVDVVDLIPVDNEISGWSRTGDMEIAENETQLWDLIDGEGVVFVDHGFVKCAFQEFGGEVQGTPRTVDVRAFDMGDTINACAVYHDSRLETGSEIPWTETGHAGIEARCEILVGYYLIEFWHGRFYVDITINDATTEAQNIAKLFALNVSEAIQRTTADPEQ